MSCRRVGWRDRNGRRSGSARYLLPLDHIMRDMGSNRAASIARYEYGSPADQTEHFAGEIEQLHSSAATRGALFKTDIAA